MNCKQIWTTGLLDINWLVDKEGVGTTRVDARGNIYRWVFNNTGGALVVGGVYFHGTAGYTYSSTKTPFAQVNSDTYGEIFTFGQSSKGTAANLLAGVALTALPSLGFGWIQIGGVNATVQVEGTTAIAATDNLKGVSGQVYLIKDTAAGTAPTSRRTAVANAAKGTAGTANISVELLCY